MNAREFFHKYRDEHPELVLTDPGWRTETVLTVMEAYHNYRERLGPVSVAYPVAAQEILADPNATKEQREEAYSQAIVRAEGHSAAPYIKAVNEELANPREWANLEARRADKAEAQLAEGHGAAEPQLEKAEAKLRELGIVREGDEYVFDGKE